MSDTFQIKTPVFEGPLDVLLDLIEKRKLLINEISLAQVADDYIAYVKNFDQFPIEHAADFVFVASALVLIKSKSLLPTLELTEEEQGSIEDLQKRLAEYKRIKELSVHVRKMFGEKMIFARVPSRITTPIFSPNQETTLEHIFAAVKNIINALPKKQFVPKVVVATVISLEEMMDRLTDRIRDNINMSFKDFVKETGATRGRINVIVGFLALLELVKQGMISVVQQQSFEDIHIKAAEEEGQ
ncbi:MAG: segregation/condensation protein A [Candidatus Yonathbacteria bacterium]|nr:segregation/condensation protein A [Candidatus Yonathbacteria bacterium]